jgi:membrane fusion protein (multidrug efflux system)
LADSGEPIVPDGPARSAVLIPVSALRKGPSGDHVFVIATDEQGEQRVRQRAVQSGSVVEGRVLIHAGLEAGERVAASGSFKLRDQALVAVDGDAELQTGGF